MHTSITSPRRLWQNNPERMAWMILLAAFATFVLLAVSIPLAVNYILQNATVPMVAQLEPTVGTVLLYTAKGSEPIAVTDERDEIPQGSRLVTTGDATQGVLGVTNRPNGNDTIGTVHLYPGTTLSLLRIRQPRFQTSREPYSMRLRLSEGRIRIFTNSPNERGLVVRVDIPQGYVVLDEGSYNFTVKDGRTDLSVSQGLARVYHESGSELAIGPGLRSWMEGSQPPGPPVSAQRNLIRNGDFSQSLLEDWEVYVEAPYVAAGTVELGQQDGRRVAHFVRLGEDGVHTEVGARQTIDQDVNGYDLLIFRVDVRLLRQTLRGAGEKSSEFPLRIEVAYTDIYGKDLTWGHGFYYRDPPTAWSVTGGEKIAPFTWYTYESPNLMELLQDTRPARINSVRVYASGWNYEAMISEVGLFAE
ncbi:MAG: hypothetical protein KF753_20120 [Caldilineaceae bacterium]|nr:hypothetical protein [Caldilineaceae bacterium]